MRRSHIAVLGGLLLIVVLVGVYTSKSTFERIWEETGKDFIALQPDETFPYTDLEGNVVDLRDYRGKTLVINSWASWCPFCKDEIPYFSALSKAAGDDVVVVLINRGEPAATVKAYLEFVGNPEGIVFLLDPADAFYKAIGGFAMPETLFYKKDGSIAAHLRGSLSYEQLEQYLELAESNQ